MKHIFFFLLCICLGQAYSQTTVMDNWYKSQEKNTFINYVVTKTDSTFSIKLKAITEEDSGRRQFTITINNENNKYLTAKSFNISADDFKNKNFKDFSGSIERKNDSLLWKMNDKRRFTDTITIDNLSLWYLITTLPTAKTGRLLDFSSMEILEFNYKENHHLDYIADEILNIQNKKINTKKITQNGNGIGESSFWLDENNRLVQIAVDNKQPIILIDEPEIALKNTD